MAAVQESSNGFSILPLQALQGPVELKIPASWPHVEFTTSGKKNRGCMILQLYSAAGEKSIFEVPLVHVDSVMVLTVGTKSAEKPAIVLQLSEFAAKNLAVTVGTDEKIEHVTQYYGEQNELAYRKMLFVLRPYKEELYVQLGPAEDKSFGGIDVLCDRFDSWVRCIRERDLLAKEQRQAEKSSCTPVMPSSSRFFARMSQAEWLRLLRSLHLFENSEAGPYLCRSLEPHATNPPRLKLGKISNRHLATMFEVDAAHQSSKNSNGTTQLTAENGTLESSAGNPNTNQRIDGATSLNDERTIQPNVMKLSSPHVVPMQGRNFVTASPHSQWQVVSQGTVGQVPANQAQYIVATTAHGPALRTQPLLIQGPGGPIIYQLSPSAQQASLMKPSASNSAKMDSSRILFVSSPNPSRQLNVPNLSQTAIAALKRPSRTSARLKKEVETIAIDDDDEIGEENESCSAGNGEANESAGDSGEPAEKRPRTDEPIKDEVLLVFPPGESGAVTLHFEDLRVLAHGEMLNDNIIEFYLKYIRARLVKKEERDKVFVFNTFFYQKLTEKQPSISILNKNHRSSVGRFEWIKKNFSKVKSWTKKVDIFKMDYIVLPINDEMHWYLAIIVKPKLAVVPQRSEDVEQARKRGSFRAHPDTYIVVLDSLPDPNDVKRKCVLDILRDYLECELVDKHGSGEGYLDRTRIGALYPQGVPHQENYVDCGLYLLQFAEAFLTKPPSGEMLRIGVKWNEWYPWFDQSMFFMREKISRRLKGLCNEKAWNRLEAYESQQGRGVSVETTAMVIERARRPRRHSDMRLHEVHPKARKRTHSEPPNIKKCAPPAPRMVP